MINLIIGRPGGGKSYEAVKFHILPAIKAGRKIITNLPLNLDTFIQVFGADVSKLITIVKTEYDDFGNLNRPFSKVEDYQDEWRSDDGAIAPLVVVDEAHMVIPTTGTDVKLLEFLSMHRHYGYDIIYISQSDRKLHRDVRDMTQMQYRCSKNTALGSQQTYTQKVQDGCRGAVVNTNQRRYEESIFKFYKSHTGSNKQVAEAMASDVRPLWKSWMVIGSALFISFAIGMFIFSDALSIFSADASDAPVPEHDVNLPAGDSSINEDYVQSSSPKKAKVEKIEKVIGGVPDFLPMEGLEAVYVSSVNFIKAGDDMKREILIEAVTGNGSYWIGDKVLGQFNITYSVYDYCLVKLNYGERSYFLGCKPRKDLKEKDNFFDEAKDVVSF
ncbi:zonular occludens toxin domain-containing protein [Photobacterium indicum]|uniref:zonular occludens toxin domain-containing protein n=1 Tax=Photobacterium indicum TaxID=81447 RepID=UPI003D0D2CE6